MSGRGGFVSAMLPTAGDYIDPARSVQQQMRRQLPKRFYKLAAAGEAAGGFALLLDGRLARTPGKHPIVLRTRAAAELAAAEWRAAGERINIAAMPVTRLVYAALDGVAREMAATAAEIVKYAGSDLVCYRAADPAPLAAAQSAAWNPVLAFARETLGARLVLAQGCVFAAQPDHAIAAVAAAVRTFDTALPLAALQAMTTLAGSALLALSVAFERFTPEAAWAAAHVDEDFQNRAWGADDEAETRRALRWQDFAAAASLLRSLTG